MGALFIKIAASLFLLLAVDTRGPIDSKVLKEPTACINHFSGKCAKVQKKSLFFPKKLINSENISLEYLLLTDAF